MRSLWLFLTCFLLFQHAMGQIEVDTTWINFTTESSALPDNFVSDIAFDDTGTTWISTWGGGLVKLSKDRKSWKIYNKENSALPNNLINHMAFDQDGVLWLATDGDVTRFDGRRWNLLKLPASENIALTVNVDHDNNVWIGTYDQGLYRYDRKQLKKVWGGVKSMDHGVNDIAFDQYGNVWVATRIGVLRFDGTNWKLFNQDNSNLRNDVYYQIEVDGKNRVWAATYPPGKFGMYDGEKWHQYTEPKPEGAAEKDFPGNYIYSMYMMSDHQILTGSQYHGALAFFDAWKEDMIVIPTPLNPMEMGVSSVDVDRAGNIWVGSWKRGLFVLDNPEPKIRQAYLDSLDQGEFEQRNVREIDKLQVSSDRVEVEVYDSKKIDGDRISLNLNGRWILKDHTLTREPKTIELWLKKNYDNHLILYAENLGQVPPNTAAMTVVDGDTRKSLVLKSDYSKSGALILRYEPKDAPDQ